MRYINWGLVGCGDIANKRIAPAVKAQPQSKLIAGMSPYPGELDEFAIRHGVERKYSSLQDMLSDDEIQAVYIATPVFLHYSMAYESLKSGKHVLVEKPMAMTCHECEVLIGTAAEHGVKLGVAYYRRFFPKCTEVKRIIREGLIGDVIQARINYHTWYNPAKDDPNAWRLLKEKSGGGPLWDIGSHKLDLLTDLLGMPRSVMAYKSTMTHEYEVEDSCSIVMEMENGAHCTAGFYWNSKLWSDEFEILGTSGKLSMIPCDSDNLELRLNARLVKGFGKETTSVAIPNHSNVHYPLIDDFVKSIIENREPVISGIEGYKANRILAAVEESASRGVRVEIK